MPINKLLIFDFDGTLLDTSEGVISSAKYALEAHHLSLPSSFDYRVFIGPPVQLTYAKLFPSFSEEKIKEICLSFRNHYRDIDLLKAHPYDGLYETLSQLKESGYQMVIASYKREDYLKTIVHAFKLDEYFSLVIGQDMEGKLSKIDIVNKAITDSHFAKENCYLIGDTNHDYDASVVVGVKFIAAMFGFGFKNEDNFSLKAYSFPQIKDLLDRE